MALKTKSIQAKRSPDDGIRICIMRRPKPEFEWDIWMPHLSPSDDVLSKRHNNEMTFEEHKVWFSKHVLDDKREYVEIVTEMSRNRDVTLLCWEIDPLTCHRSWVADYIMNNYSDIEVILK